MENIILAKPTVSMGKEQFYRLLVVLWGFYLFYFIFGQSSKKAPHFKELSYRCRSGKKTFQRGRNLTGFNLELDCFIKGIM